MVLGCIANLKRKHFIYGFIFYIWLRVIKAHCQLGTKYHILKVELKTQVYISGVELLRCTTYSRRDIIFYMFYIFIFGFKLLRRTVNLRRNIMVSFRVIKTHCQHENSIFWFVFELLKTFY